ncbi:MAG: hypothetical protein ACYTET_04475 [Planctomycetota bacterium]
MEKTALQNEIQAEPETKYAGSAESVLIRIPDDVTDALCAEPAIRKYSQEKLSSGQLTICCEHADLYVGHPAIGGIMYDLTEEDRDRFTQTIVLEPVEGSVDERMERYGEQLDVKLDQDVPNIYLTGLDWIRIERFGLSKMDKPTVAMVLSDDTAAADLFNELALILHERFGFGIVFLSSIKQKVPETEKNLTGRLMPREMAAVFSKVDCWVSDSAASAVLSLAVSSKGILLGSDSDIMDCPQVETVGFDTDIEEICRCIAGLCYQEK